MRMIDATAPALIALGLVGTACHAASSEGVEPLNRPQDVSQLVDLEVAANSAPTMDGFAAYIAERGVEADLSAPGWYEGREQYVAMVKQQFDMVQQLKADVIDPNVVTDGTLGCIAAQMHIQGTLKDGSKLSISFRILDAWKKIDGHWQYTQLHISYPLDPETGAFMKDMHAPVRGPVSWGAEVLRGPDVSIAQAKSEISIWVEASTKITTVEDMLQYYGADGDLVFFDVGEQLRGREEIRANFAPILASARGIQVKTPASFVDSDGMIGVQISHHRVSVSYEYPTTIRQAIGRWS